MSKMLKDSLIQAFTIVTGVATVFTILGLSMKDAFPLEATKNIVIAVMVRLFIVLGVFCVLTMVAVLAKKIKYKESIELRIFKNKVKVEYGDIFEKDGWRVIGVDTTFSTVIDNIVISKLSLHGQLVLEHGDVDDINEAVKREATRRGIKEKRGVYSFPLGTAIPYEGKDGKYIMVALTELNRDYESHTRLPQYEKTLLEMWKELSRVYAGNELVVPLLGTGITRFDDGRDDATILLRCMLCTLNLAGIHFNSRIRIVLFPDTEIKSSLYEYKDIFKISK